METKPQVSYILGILNAERTLEECLTSIFSQKTKIPYEVIVIDGGSQDSTLLIVNRFKKNHRNLKVYHNPHRLSEGKGMSKDIGVHKARGEIVIFIDHDNILLGTNWLNTIIAPFKNEQIIASQSLLSSRPGDSLFLQYINEIGVEDPFAIPYSLVAQVQQHPVRFKKGEQWYEYAIDPDFPLFGGANGCAFRKKVFSRIGGYTRDVDVFASMSLYRMNVAIPPNARIHHKTSASFFSYLYKKGRYFNRFITREYKTKTFSWIPRTLKGKLWFLGYVLFAITFIGPFIYGIIQIILSGKRYWLMHPFYLWTVTCEYFFLSLLRLPQLMSYALRFSRTQ